MRFESLLRLAELRNVCLLVGLGAACCPQLLAGQQIPDCVSGIRQVGTTDAVTEAHGLYDRGCRVAAEDMGRRLLSDLAGRAGSEALDLADVLDLLSRTAYGLGHRDEPAIEQARRALAIRLSQPGSDPAASAETHRLLASLLAAQNEKKDYAEALQLYERARLLWEEALGSDNLETVDLMTWIAEVLNDWGPEGWVEAQKLVWVRDLFDSTTRTGTGVLREAKRRGLTEFVARQPGSMKNLDLPMAIALHAVSRGGLIQELAPEHAEALNALGTLLNDRRLYREALSAYEECLRVRAAIFPQGHYQIARSVHNRGLSLTLVGKLEEARVELLRSLEMHRNIFGDRYPRMVGTSYMVLGELFYFTGDLDASLLYYRKALPLVRAAHGAGNMRHIFTLAATADVHLALADFEEAENLLLRALAEAEKAGSSDDADGAMIRSRLGQLFVRQGKFSEGQELLLTAREMQESFSPRPQDDYAATLSALADIAEARDLLPDALTLRLQAVESLDQYDGPHPKLAGLLLDTARLQLGAGSVEEATRTLTRVSQLLPNLGETAYLSRSEYHLQQALLLVASDRLDEALTEALTAGELSTRHLTPALGVLPQDVALHYASQNRSSLNLMLQLLAELEPSSQQIARAWELVASNRGLVLAELGRRYAGARRSVEPEIRNVLEELEEARRNLADSQIRALTVASVEESRVITQHADRRLRTAERALATKRPLLRFAGEPTPSLEAMIGALPEGASLVAYVRSSGSLGKSDARYFAFVTSARTHRTRFIPLESAGIIDGQIGSWREALFETWDSARIGGDEWSNAEKRLNGVGERLRRMIWDPIAPEVAATSEVLIVPDGGMFLMPLGALPGRAGRKYLVEDGYDFHRLTSEADLLSASKSGVRPQALLAVGGPDFNAGKGNMQTAGAKPPWLQLLKENAEAVLTSFVRDPCLGEDSFAFLPLPHAEQEAEGVASVFRQATGDGTNVTVLRGAEASTAEFTRLAPSHSVLHIATHGFFDLHCRDEGDSLGVEDLLLGRSREASFVPGLAFAGANWNLNEGVLTASEIANLDLSETDWVVLSACETGLGQIAAGEGVLGLARSFQLAGASSLILSLWPVEDQATREWMNELYKARFLEGLSTASSVSRASRRILERRRVKGEPTHPYLWAGFVGIGSRE